MINENNNNSKNIKKYFELFYNNFNYYFNTRNKLEILNQKNKYFSVY